MFAEFIDDAIMSAISKMLTRKAKKHGYNFDINVESFEIHTKNETVEFNINATGTIGKKDLINVINSIK